MILEKVFKTWIRIRFLSRQDPFLFLLLKIKFDIILGCPQAGPAKQGQELAKRQAVPQGQAFKSAKHAPRKCAKSRYKP